MAAPAPQSAPAWANELKLAYESRASSQFILFGNVHDRVAVGEKLVNLADFLEDTLLKSFGVVLSYDMGTGLIIERGGEIVAKWQGAELQQQMREPLQAVQVDRPLPSIPRQPARARQQREDSQRRGHRAQRGSHRAALTARDSSTAASRACCVPGPATPRSPTCRSPVC